MSLRPLFVYAVALCLSIPALAYPPELAAVRDPLIQMISEITQVPVSKIDLDFDVGNPPSTLAAIVTTSMQRALQVKEGKQVTGHKLHVIISTSLLDDYSPYDARLKGVIAHEYFHNVLGNKIERQALNEMLSDSDFDPRAARLIQQAVQKFALPRLHEFYADSQAQRRLIEMGEYPFAMIELMETFSKMDSKTPPSVTEYVQKSHPRSARRKDFLENDLQEMIDRGELPAREALIATPKTTKFIDFYRDYRKTDAFKIGAVANYEEQLKAKIIAATKKIRDYKQQPEDSFNNAPYIRSNAEDLKQILKQAVSPPNVEAETEVAAVLAKLQARFIPDVHAAHLLMLRNQSRVAKTPESLAGFIGDYHYKIDSLEANSPFIAKFEKDKNTAYAELIDRAYDLLYTSKLPLRERAALTKSFEDHFFKVNGDHEKQAEMRGIFFAEVAARLSKQPREVRNEGLKNLADLFRFEERFPSSDYRKLIGYPSHDQTGGIVRSSENEQYVGRLAEEFYHELPTLIREPLKENPSAAPEWISLLSDHRSPDHSYVDKEAKEILANALKRLSPVELQSIALEDVLLKARTIDIDLSSQYESLSGPLEARLKAQLDPGKYTAVAAAHPGLKDTVERAVTHHLETFRQQASTSGGPDAWHTRFFSELLLGHNKLGDAALFDLIQKETTQRAMARLEESLQGTSEEVSSRAAKALQKLEFAHVQEWAENRPGPGHLNRLKRTALSKTLSSDTTEASEASIQLAFLSGEANDRLSKALATNKEQFLLELFHSADLNGKASFGADPISLKFLRRNFPDQSLLDATIAKAIAQQHSHFDFESFTRVFGRSLRLSDFIDAPLPAKDKVDLLARISVLTENPDEVALLEKLLRNAENDWVEGRLNFGHFLKIHSNVSDLLQTPQAELSNVGRMSVSMKRAMDRYIANMLAKTPSKTERIKRLRALVKWQDHLPEGQKGTWPTSLGFDGVESILDQTAVKQWRSEVKGDPAGLSDLHRSNLSYTGYSNFNSLNQGDFIQEVYDSILASKLPVQQRLRMISGIRKNLTTKGLDLVWERFSSEMLYGKPYRPEVASDLLQRIYGDYHDGQNRKMNEIFDRFKLNPKQMSVLKDSLTSGTKRVKTIVSADVLLAAIDHSVGTPRESIEFLAWLQGRTENAPATAERVLDQVHQLQAQRSDEQRLTEDQLRDIYQNNHPAVRVAMVTPLVSPNDERGLLATKEGRDLLVEFLIDGMDARKAGDLRFISELYLEALGPEGHPIIARLVAAHGKAESHSDAQKISGFVQSRGSLWVKLAQQGSADETLIGDPELREAFGLLKEWNNIPERPDIYTELERIMGDQYKQIASVEEVKGGGSINVAVLVTLKNGKQYMARYVRNNPDISVDYELNTMLRFADLLEARALASQDPAFKRKWLRNARFLKEYLPTLAAKIRDEAKLSRDKGLAAMLRPSYTKDYSDLGVKVRLIEPEEPIAFKTETHPKGADPNRLVLTSFMEVAAEDSLTHDEQERFAKGMFRTELEAIFLGKFDPDGHEKNYLKLRSPQNPKQLELFRFDISQGEEIDESTREALRKSMAFFMQKRHRALSWLSSISEEAAYKSFLQLTEGASDSPELRRQYDKAVGDVLGEAVFKDPISILREVKFRVENEMGGKAIPFKPSIHLAIKSLHLIKQLIDAKTPSNQGFLVQELTRVIQKQPSLVSKLMGIGASAWQRVRTKAAEYTAAAEKTDKADFNKQWIVHLEKDGISVKTLGSLEEMIDRSPDLKDRIFKLVHDKLGTTEEGADRRTRTDEAEMLFGFLKKHDPGYLRTILNDLKAKALGIRKKQAKLDAKQNSTQLIFSPGLGHILALQDITANHHVASYGDAASAFLIAPEIGEHLSNSTILTDDFRSRLEAELVKRIPVLTLDHLMQLDARLYPAVHARAAEIIPHNFNPKSAYTYFADGHYLSATNGKYYELVANEILEASRKEEINSYGMSDHSMSRLQRENSYESDKAKRSAAGQFNVLIPLLVEDAKRTGSPTAVEAYRLVRRTVLKSEWGDSDLNSLRDNLREALPHLKLSDSQWVSLLNDSNDALSKAVAQELNQRGFVELLKKSTRPQTAMPTPVKAADTRASSTEVVELNPTHRLMKTAGGYRLINAEDTGDVVELPASNRLAQWYFDNLSKSKGSDTNKKKATEGTPIEKADPVLALKKSATAGGLASIWVDYYWNSFGFPFAPNHYSEEDLRSLIRYYETNTFSEGPDKHGSYRAGAAMEIVYRLVNEHLYDDKDHRLVLTLLEKLPRGLAVSMVSGGGGTGNSSKVTDELRTTVMGRHTQKAHALKAVLADIMDRGYLDKSLAERLRSVPIDFTELAELETFLHDKFTVDRRRGDQLQTKFPLLEVMRNLQYVSDDVKITAEGFLDKEQRGSPLHSVPSTMFRHLKGAFRNCEEVFNFLAPPVGLTHK